jgi:hypothetical protein
MYPSGYGLEAIQLIEKTETLNNFRKAVIKFNEGNHNYKEQLFYPDKKDIYIKENVMNMNGDKKYGYYDLYFSDWLFIKNFSDDVITIVTRDKKEMELKPNEQVALSFGDYENHYRNSKECEVLIGERR